MSFHCNKFPSMPLQNEIFILGIIEVVIAIVCFFGYTSMTALCVVQIMFFEDKYDGYLLYSFLLQIGESLLMIILGFSAISTAKQSGLNSTTVSVRHPRSRSSWKWKHLAFISMALAVFGIGMTMMSGYYIFIVQPSCRIIFHMFALWRMQIFEAGNAEVIIPSHVKPKPGASSTN